MEVIPCNANDQKINFILIKEMVAKNMKVAKYKITDYWLDIGRIDDYDAAQDAYNQYFSDDKT